MVALDQGGKTGHGAAPTGLRRTSWAWSGMFCSNFAYILLHALISWGFPSGSVVKNLPANAGDAGDMGFLARAWKEPLEEAQPTPALLPGESHGQRSLMGYTP